MWPLYNSSTSRTFTLRQGPKLLIYPMGCRPKMTEGPFGAPNRQANHSDCFCMSCSKLRVCSSACVLVDFDG